MHVRDRSEMPVCLRPTAFRSISSGPNCASNENLTDSRLVSPTVDRNDVGRYRYLDAVDVHWRGGQARSGVVNVPEV